MFNSEIGGFFGHAERTPESPYTDPPADQTRGKEVPAEQQPDDPELYWALFEERYRPGELDSPLNPPTLNTSS